MSNEGDGTQNGTQVVESRKKKVKGGHWAHLTKMLTEVTTSLTGYKEEREAKVLTLKSCLERKPVC